MSRTYHWVTEELDSEGDITNVLFDDSFPGMPVPGKTDVALVVDDDRLGRAWAYVRDGFLPASMEDAHGIEIMPTPARFIREMRAAN